MSELSRGREHYERRRAQAAAAQKAGRKSRNDFEGEEPGPIRDQPGCPCSICEADSLVARLEKMIYDELDYDGNETLSEHLAAVMIRDLFIGFR